MERGGGVFGGCVRWRRRQGLSVHGAVWAKGGQGDKILIPGAKVASGVFLRKRGGVFTIHNPFGDLAISCSQEV